MDMNLARNFSKKKNDQHSLAIRDVQIWTTLIFHLTQSEWQRPTELTSASEDVGIKEHSSAVVGIANCPAFLGISMKNSQEKNKKRKEIYHVTQLYHYLHIPKDLTSHSTGTCSAMFIFALFTTAGNWEEPKSPSSKKKCT